VGFVACFGDREAGEVGDNDLASVNGKAYGDESGGESYREHGQGFEEKIEEALHLSGQGYRVVFRAAREGESA
jgi:hypothetical protein